MLNILRRFRKSNKRSYKSKAIYLKDMANVVHFFADCNHITGRTVNLGPEEQAWRFHICEICGERNEQLLNEAIPHVILGAVVGLQARDKEA